MKKTLKAALVGSILAFGFTGCGKLITVEKEKSGATAYMMNYEIKLPVKKGGLYHGYDINSYEMDFKEVNGIVTVELRHRVTFTVGSGTPVKSNASLKDWMPERFYHNPISFDIVGLPAIKHTGRVRQCSLIIDSCKETIKAQYSKAAFVKFFRKAKNAKVEIHYGNEKRTVYIPNIEKLNKYAKCLENPVTCNSK